MLRSLQRNKNSSQLFPSLHVRSNDKAALFRSRLKAIIQTAVFCGLRFQESIERRAFALGGDYRAPATTLGAFMTEEGRGGEDTSLTDAAIKAADAPPAHLTSSLRPTYARGVAPCSLEALFPSFITDSLRAAILDFEAYQPGFYDPDAILTAPETRSTSPIRIERDPVSYQSISHKGLYPIGEGAGYSGGILSSATDAIRAVLAYLQSRK